MKKTFRVVCVTKRTIADNPGSKILWHQDITGEAILDTDEGFVQFHGLICPVHYVGRSGLGETSFMIGMKVDDGCFDLWELYTDTPSGKKDATPEEIRECAKRMIADNK